MRYNPLAISINTKDLVSYSSAYVVNPVRVRVTDYT